MTRKLISFDWAIKKILRSKANFSILEGFLSELLFTDIQILEILESEANQERFNDKFNRVDIKVKDSQQRLLIIEVQYSRELDYLQRMLYASSKTISEHIDQGEAYAKVSKVISINILYFDFGNGDDYIYHGSTEFIGLHSQTKLQLNQQQQALYQCDSIPELYPEYYLIELRNFNDIAKNTLDEWIYFLKNEQVEQHFTAKGLKQAKQTLDVIKMSDSERISYEQHQQQLHHEASLYESTYVLGHLEGKVEGKAEGKAEGLAQGRAEADQAAKAALLNTARNMKNMGMSVEDIMTVTGLSETVLSSI
jgi:predicted transposase/invertase (TIGR01784 family)